MLWFDAAKELTIMTTKDIRQTVQANYFQPAFLICAAVLVITGSVMSAVLKLTGAYLVKEPCLLKKTLDNLDSSNLAPYKVAAKGRITNLDEVETLGTEDYIQWTLEDTSVAETSNTRFCMLFVTYYSLPDKVPHVPEECYTGGGLKRVSSEKVDLKIKKTASDRQISTRYLVFTGTRSSDWLIETSFPILYTFSVNGEYGAGREDVRLIMNRNLLGKYSYFSKVEWKFYNNKLGHLVYPNKQEALEASEKLLAVVLPVLEQEHWPSGLW